MTARSLTEIANDRDFDTTLTVEYDTDQTAAAALTPSTGKVLQIVGVKFSCEGAGNAADSVRLFFSTTGDTVFEWYPGTSPASFDTGDIFVQGAQNEVLSLTSNLDDTTNFFLAINYREN